MSLDPVTATRRDHADREAAEAPFGTRLQPEEFEPVLLDNVPFGRSRFMALVAGVVTMLGVRMVLPPAARAYHGDDPFPCFGYGSCHCCVGTLCCEPFCSYTTWLGCPSGGQCWYSCYCGYVWHCCDWDDGQGHRCICTARTSSVCGGGC